MTGGVIYAWESIMPLTPLLLARTASARPLVEGREIRGGPKDAFYYCRCRENTTNRSP